MLSAAGGGPGRWMPYEEAAAFVQGLNLKSNQEWRAWKRKHKVDMPLRLPRVPQTVYRDRGWRDWGAFLGTNTTAKPISRNRMPFEEARALVRAGNFKGMKEFRAARLPGVTTAPHIVYKNKGYIDLADWLGQDSVRAKPVLRFRPTQHVAFPVARELARATGKTKEEWAAYMASKTDMTHGNRMVTAWPERVYKGNGWRGWNDFLGTTNPNQNLRTEDFPVLDNWATARAFVRSLHLAGPEAWYRYTLPGPEAWYRYTQQPTFPTNLPVRPELAYVEWDGYDDWIGYEPDGVEEGPADDVEETRRRASAAPTEPVVKPAVFADDMDEIRRRAKEGPADDVEETRRRAPAAPTEPVVEPAVSADDMDEIRRRALAASAALVAGDGPKPTAAIGQAFDGAGVGLYARRPTAPGDIIARYIVQLYDSETAKETSYSVDTNLKGSARARFFWDMPAPTPANAGGAFQQRYALAHLQCNAVRDTGVAPAVDAHGNVLMATKTAHRTGAGHFVVAACTRGNHRENLCVYTVPNFGAFSNEPLCARDANARLVDVFDPMDIDGNTLKARAIPGLLESGQPVFTVLALIATRFIEDNEEVKWCYGSSYESHRTGATGGTAYTACQATGTPECPTGTVVVS